jgi:hypothetical protein
MFIVSLNKKFLKQLDNMGFTGGEWGCGFVELIFKGHTSK